MHFLSLYQRYYRFLVLLLFLPQQWRMNYIILTVRYFYSILWVFIMAEKTESQHRKAWWFSKKDNRLKVRNWFLVLVYFIGVIYLFNQVKLDEFNQFYQSLLLHPTGISLKSYVELYQKLFFDIVLPIIIVTFYLAQSFYLAPF